MGAYSPAPVVTEAVHQRIMTEVIEPIVAGMSAEGNDYTGFLYAGLMITPDGAPKVIEYNCRFGDPETWAIMMRLQSDLVDLCNAALDIKLDQASANWDERAAVGVVLAAGGYPGSYDKGLVISGLPEIEAPNQKVFHAGTQLDAKQQVLTNGGRVLCATALGDTVKQAAELAYQCASGIQWQGSFYRKDIAYRAIVREE